MAHFITNLPMRDFGCICYIVHIKMFERCCQNVLDICCCRDNGSNTRMVRMTLTKLLKLAAVLVFTLVFLITLMRRFEVYRKCREKFKHEKNFEQHTLLISSAFEVNGLGNLMFQYASLLGIAHHYQMTPVISSSLRLQQHFHLSAITMNETRPGVHWGKVIEKTSSAFESRIVSIQSPSVNLELIGFFQSWRYFDNIKEQVRKEFIPNFDVRSKAKLFMEAAEQDFKQKNNRTKPVVVGIHIRRGDMASERFQKIGYTIADLNYIKKAMSYYENKYKYTLFIVCSDDINWCEENISTNQPNQTTVVYSRNNDDITDLSILSQSDHIIISTGTFSWWSGWLCKGSVVYYKQFPQNGSKLATMFSNDKSDYFPPHWIGL